MSTENSKLRGVAIGAGYFSQFHFDAWKRIDDVELVAICDRDPAAATTAAKKYGVLKTYTDVESMLDTEQPDFVDIITGPDSHFELTRLAVDRKIAVICQKPLAPNFVAACRLVEYAESAGVPLMVHENFRFQPWHREIKSLMDSGAIGELKSISLRCRMGDGWQPDAYLARQPYFRDMPRFFIHETGVHFLDTFRFLAGEIDGVYASLRKLNESIAGEDAASVMIEFASGAQGMIDANRYNESNDPDPRYTFGEVLIEGSDGSLRLYLDGRITIQILGQAEEEHSYFHERKNFSGDCVLATQQHFANCIRTEVPFETSGHDYLKTLQVVEAVYQSGEQRMPVRNILVVDQADMKGNP